MKILVEYVKATGVIQSVWALDTAVIEQQHCHDDCALLPVPTAIADDVKHRPTDFLVDVANGTIGLRE